MVKVRHLCIADPERLEAMPPQWGEHSWLDVITGVFEGAPLTATHVNVGAVYTEDESYDYHLYGDKMQELHNIVWYYPDVESLFLGSTPYVVCMLSVKHAPRIQPWLDACPKLKRLGILGYVQYPEIQEGLIGLELQELWAINMSAQNTLDMLESLTAPLERLTICLRSEYSRTGDPEPEWAAGVLSRFPGLKHLGIINAETRDFDDLGDWELILGVASGLKLPILETLDLTHGDWNDACLQEFLEALNPEHLPSLREIQVGGMWVVQPKIPAKWAHLQIVGEPRNPLTTYRYANCNE